ncbi:MAG: hypothetical protein AAGD00_11015 [Planctomycetota bacterium]
MASRTTASLGMMLTLAVFTVLALAFFILSIVFFAQTQRLTREKGDAISDLAAAIPANQRGDRWDELRSAAGRDGVVPYLDDSLQQTMRLVSGSSRETLETLQSKIDDRFGDGAPNLLTIVQDRDAEINRLNRELDRARQSAEDAIAERRRAEDRIEDLRLSYEESIADNSSEVRSFTSQVAGFGADLEETKLEIEGELLDIRGESEAVIDSLENELSQRDNEILILREQLASLRGERSTDTLRAPDEAALVDGRVVGVNPSANEVYIDRGRVDRVVLGMTFELYSARTSIRPDEDGVYPRGKAAVEVIRVEDRGSVARVIRSSDRNVIVEGDVIANAVYDPSKTYSFVVFGSFDADRDGIATPREAQDIKAIIEEWGGVVTDDVSGDTDFLVLGEKPLLPPEPKRDDPVALINRYLELRDVVLRYDRLFEAATRTSIPILNENRLYSLTGLDDRT